MQYQINHVTKVSYSGNNQEALSITKSRKKYKSNEWLTFVQARNTGRQIKKGERGVALIKVIPVQDRKTKKDSVRVTKFVVFNLDQTVIKEKESVH